MLSKQFPQEDNKQKPKKINSMIDGHKYFEKIKQIKEIGRCCLVWGLEEDFLKNTYFLIIIFKIGLCQFFIVAC